MQRKQREELRRGSKWAGAGARSGRVALIEGPRCAVREWRHECACEPASGHPRKSTLFLTLPPWREHGCPRSPREGAPRRD
eukprot:4532930-Pleurochrysis_carterae.AAC.1